MLKSPVGVTQEARYIPSLTLLLGSAIGGTILAVVVWVLSIVLSPAPSARIGLAISVTSLALLGIVLPRTAPWLPERACQVSKTLLHTSSTANAALRWGVQLGLGVTTFSVTPALHAFLGTVLLLETPASIAMVCLLYAVVRGGAICFFALVPGPHVAPGSDERRVVGLANAMRLPLGIAAVLSCTIGVWALA